MKSRILKSLLSFVLVIIFVLSSTSILEVSADNIEADDKVAVELGTSGSEENPNTEEKEEEAKKEEETKEEAEKVVEILTGEDLFAFAKRVNDGDSMVDITVELKSDIKLTGKWTPIGMSLETPFSGIFKGNGHTIDGIDLETDAIGGLFGYLVDAEIGDFVLGDIIAPKSTAGIFFFATRSTVENVKYALSQVPAGQKALTFSLFASPYSSAWSGGATYVWYTTHVPGAPYVLDTADDFAGFANIVNGLDSQTHYSFAGDDVILSTSIDLSTNDWTPIGNWTNADQLAGTTKPFSGKFSGAKNQIEGLNYTGSDGFGMFGYTLNADLTEFSVIDARITTNNAYAAAVVLYGAGTNITSVNVIEPIISVSGYERNLATDPSAEVPAQGAGIAIFFTQDSGPYSYDYQKPGSSAIKTVGKAGVIRSCLVYKPIITGDSTAYASGVVVLNANYGVLQNVVYKGQLSGVRTNGVVAAEEGPEGTYTTTSQNLVLGTVFDASGVGSGIINVAQAWNEVSDNFVSGISNINSTGIFHVGTGAAPFGVSRMFTDSPLSDPLVTNNLQTVQNYWDNISPRTVPTSGKNGNQALSTAYLINGDWNPNGATWESKENYYPQIKGLKNAPSKYINGASGLASVALIPGDEFEKYTTGVRELYLMKRTANNDLISWIGVPTAVKRIDDPANDYIILKYEDNAHVAPFDLTAKVTITDTDSSLGSLEFEKNFNQVQIVDSVLEEDVPLREPTMNAVVTTTQKIKVYFKDPIEVNPNVLDVVRLYTVDSGGIETQEQTIICDPIRDNRFEIDTVSNVVTLSFSLDTGKEYHAVVPKGLVREVAATGMGYEKNNESDFMDFRFEVPEDHAVVIDPQYILWEGSTENPLSKQELLDSFIVYNTNDGGVNKQVIYDKTSTALLQEYSSQHGAWDATDPRQSMTDILNAATGSVVYYHLENATVVGTPAIAGKAKLYIMAKNDVGQTDRKIIDIVLVGNPEWIGGPPDPAIHISETDDIGLVLNAARQGASAGYLQADGTYMPVMIDVLYDNNKWLDIVVNIEYSPQQLDTELVVSNYVGDVVLRVPVAVYIDKPLIWQMTPSPVTMSYTNKKKVEEKMNVITKTFPSSDIIYTHFMEDKYFAENKELWHNQYREAGLYYVDISSKPQIVTRCTNTRTDCEYKGDHPDNKVNDTFILNIIKTPAEETTSYWGKIYKEYFDGQYLENTAYSQKNVQLSPTSYELPVFIIEALVKQKYGKAEITYNDTYRWNLYSDTLDNSYKWSELYNLETHIVSNDEVTKLVGGTSKGMQIRFEQTGKLFGKVAFDINLGKIASVYKGLPKKNLGLYAYDKESGELKLVSDIMITDDNWASATISEIIPTTYVLKAKDEGDVVIQPQDDFKEYYLVSKEKGKYGEWVEPTDVNPVLIDEKKDLTEIEEIITGEKSSKLYYTGPKTSTVITTGVIIVLLIGAAIVVYFYKMRRESK